MPEIVVQVLVDPLLVRQDDAAEATALAVDVLGGRIDDDVSAEFQRLLLQRRGEDIVHHQPRADRIGDRCHRRDVDHFERRVRRAFEEEQFRVWLDRLFPVADIGAVDQRRFDAVFGRQRLHYPAAGAEQRARRNDMVAGPEAAQDGGRNSGHARRRRPRVLGALQRAHALFEHVDGGIGVPRIDEARLLALEARLGGFGRVVDIALREVDRLGRLAELRSLGSGMHELRRRFPVALLGRGHDASPKTQKPAAKNRNRSIWPWQADGPLAICLTWLQADRPNHHGINVH